MGERVVILTDLISQFLRDTHLYMVNLPSNLHGFQPSALS